MPPLVLSVRECLPNLVSRFSDSDPFVEATHDGGGSKKPSFLKKKLSTQMTRMSVRSPRRKSRRALALAVTEY